MNSKFADFRSIRCSIIEISTISMAKINLHDIVILG